MRAFVFPGQGAQHVGMGKDFFETFSEARSVFEEVDEALSQHLSRLIFSGDEKELTRTINAQPALMAVSLAILRSLLKEVGRPFETLAFFSAGHSLGEYSALAAAQVLSLSETARLLRLRGKSMQEAVPEGQGGMAAVLGGDFDKVEALAREAEEKSGALCVVANDNCPGQIVISGQVEAIAMAQSLAESYGFKKVIPLPVSAPFHSPLMEPAAKALEKAFEEAVFLPPVLGVFSNVTAMPIQDFSQTPHLLTKQVTERVRWRESMENMVALGVTEIVEIGAGKVLAGLVKRICPEVITWSIGTPQDMEAWMGTL